MESFVIDTHALAWYFTSDSRLSSKVEKIILDTEAGINQMIIPIIVLAELLHISDRKRIEINFDYIVKELQNHPNFLIVSLDINIFENMLDLQSFEIHDRVIAATARYFGYPLLTKDSELRSSKLIETIW